ncbi:hypothetical protein GCM10009738_11690 [Kitasatospora viridis]
MILVSPPLAALTRRQFMALSGPAPAGVRWRGGPAGLLLLLVAALGLIAHHSLTPPMAMSAPIATAVSPAAMSALMAPDGVAATDHARLGTPTAQHALPVGSSGCEQEHCTGTPQQPKPLPAPALPGGLIVVARPAADRPGAPGFPSRSGAPPPDLVQLSVSRT